MIPGTGNFQGSRFRQTDAQEAPVADALNRVFMGAVQFWVAVFRFHLRAYQCVWFEDVFCSGGRNKRLDEDHGGK